MPTPDVPQLKSTANPNSCAYREHGRLIPEHEARWQRCVAIPRHGRSGLASSPRSVSGQRPQMHHGVAIEPEPSSCQPDIRCVGNDGRSDPQGGDLAGLIRLAPAVTHLRGSLARRKAPDRARAAGANLPKGRIRLRSESTDDARNLVVQHGGEVALECIDGREVPAAGVRNEPGHQGMVARGLGRHLGNRDAIQVRLDSAVCEEVGDTDVECGPSEIDTHRISGANLRVRRCLATCGRPSGRNRQQSRERGDTGRDETTACGAGSWERACGDGDPVSRRARPVHEIRQLSGPCDVAGAMASMPR